MALGLRKHGYLGGQTVRGSGTRNSIDREARQHCQGFGAFLIPTLLMVLLAIACGDGDEMAVTEEPVERVQLVPPRHRSDTSVEEALLNRRSVREYTGEALALAEVQVSSNTETKVPMPELI